MRLIYSLIAIALLCMTGCTSVNIRPISAEHQITSVVIKENPKVAVADFLDVLVDGFERNGIKAKVVSESTEVHDGYSVNYVAYRKWDLAPYLVDATIGIYKNGERIAQAQYHLKGGGGFSMMKWQGTKTKIDPVIDELLKDLKTKALK